MAATYFDSQSPGDAGNPKNLPPRFSGLWSILITLGDLMAVANTTFQQSRNFAVLQIEIAQLLQRSRQQGLPQARGLSILTGVLRRRAKA
jgi:hypothetical protein